MAPLLQIAEVRLVHFERLREVRLAKSPLLSGGPDSLTEDELKFGGHGSHAQSIIGEFLSVNTDLAKHGGRCTIAPSAIRRRPSRGDRIRTCDLLVPNDGGWWDKIPLREET